MQDLPEPDDGTTRRRRVLVVDDEALIRWALQSRLTESGWGVSEADSAAGALDAIVAAAVPFDVVLLDLWLPDSDDLQLLSRIRQLGPESRVILMTAFTTPELVRGALALGAARVLTKPFAMSELAGLVGAA